MQKENLLQVSGDISIVLCGPAGAGIQTVEQLLVKIFQQAGYHIFATKEYMSRVRGGLNSTTIRVGSGPVRGLVDRIDLLIPLSKGAIAHVRKRISRQTLVLCEPEHLDDSVSDVRHIEVPFTQIAKEIGDKLFSNIVAVGVVGAILSVDLSVMSDFIATRFAGKDEKLTNGNIEALKKGHEIGSELVRSGTVQVEIQADEAVKGDMLINGVEAVGLGALAGGCNFIGAYPMSPSTGLLTFLAKHGKQFGIAVEQAEDEIAGINMGLGAWYAGARAVASTSGGGFALMTEGLSLAGMIESPLVIHVAQRPGPATGLPTRTGQEDLNLVLYAGHGEFARAVFAPGTLQEAYELTAQAFEVADRFQVPVFVLTDQYFVDTYYNTPRFEVTDGGIEHGFVRTEKDYRRYALTEDGLSPRGIPGYGEGLVVVDSDEHDEHGHITEDLEIRVRMVDKRLGRRRLLAEAVVEPTLWPDKDYETLVLCWGSTLSVVQEAIGVLGREGVSLLHFGQVWPLPKNLKDRLERAKKLICLEGNATGQFAALARRETGVDIVEKILKYNGLQFTVEEAAASLGKIIG
jgi:2-oxoglutarate ferredoxin oxidoreductase subunit alpha